MNNASGDASNAISLGIIMAIIGGLYQFHWNGIYHDYSLRALDPLNSQMKSISDEVRRGVGLLHTDLALTVFSFGIILIVLGIIICTVPPKIKFGIIVVVKILFGITFLVWSIYYPIKIAGIIREAGDGFVEEFIKLPLPEQDEFMSNNRCDLTTDENNCRTIVVGPTKQLAYAVSSFIIILSTAVGSIFNGSLDTE